MEPQTQQPPAAPPVAQAEAQAQFIKATPVVSFPSRHVLLNAQPAMLLWHADNTVSLQLVGAAQPVFHCPAQNIAKFLYMTDHTTITLGDGQAFMIGFNKAYLKNIVTGGAAGIAGDLLGKQLGPLAAIAGDAVFFKKMYDINKDDTHNDSQWWVDSLARFGAKTTRISFLKMFGFVLLGIIGLLLLAAIIIAITNPNS